MRTTTCLTALLLLAACGTAEGPAGEPDAGDTATVAASAGGAPAGGPAEPVAPDTAPDGTLTAEGWGPLRIGMTREEVVAAAGEDAHPEAVGGPEPERCDEFRPERAPAGLLVMVEEGRLTRISLGSGSAVRTAEGFGVGDPAVAVRAAYGERARVTPHKYSSAPAEYVTIWTRGSPPDPDARGIVYEIGVDGRVGRIHAGGPSIQYVEGCL